MFEIGDDVKYLGIEHDLPEGQRGLLRIGGIYTIVNKDIGFWFGSGFYGESCATISFGEIQGSEYCYPAHGFEKVEGYINPNPRQNVKSCISEMVKSRSKRRKRA